MRSRLIFLVGGPDLHPVNEQAEHIVRWLGPDFWCHTADSLAAFEHLNECDLLVLMGMHYVGWGARYRSPNEAHRRNFQKYVASGRPLLSAHGGIASYDDWPGFAEMVGFRWPWDAASNSLIAEHRVRILNTGHPIVEAVEDFTLVDELHDGIQVTPGLKIRIHAEALLDGRQLPMVMTATGGRKVAGAGKTAYLANGHDMRAFECPAMKQLWVNAVRWCLG
jgi:type 1 glutamine amidotransferase